MWLTFFTFLSLKIFVFISKIVFQKYLGKKLYSGFGPSCFLFFIHFWKILFPQDLYWYFSFLEYFQVGIEDAPVSKKGLNKIISQTLKRKFHYMHFKYSFGSDLAKIYEVLIYKCWYFLMYSQILNIKFFLFAWRKNAINIKSASFTIVFVLHVQVINSRGFKLYILAIWKLVNVLEWFNSRQMLWKIRYFINYSEMIFSYIILNEL